MDQLQTQPCAEGNTCSAPEAHAFMLVQECNGSRDLCARRRSDRRPGQTLQSISKSAQETGVATLFKGAFARQPCAGGLCTVIRNTAVWDDEMHP